uniref:Uncharacterized protein n=1 Tax=Helicotheca tamesis TaxID=374047 RepID=A0A7S2IBY6_9STRA|mmetsp:Transcript_7605/g.10349  ORF Transcript_7605/g.10349 Transcript_7605/m.10349 type:complete len:403 (+) Transcript_7605:2-1210(+)
MVAPVSFTTGLAAAAAAAASIANVSAFGFVKSPINIRPSQQAVSSSKSRSFSSSSLHMATWSNGQAIREYQDFLSTGKSELDVAEDGPSVIVASPHDTPAQALVEGIVSLGMGDDIVVAPGAELPKSMGEGNKARESYPIYVAVPPYQLEAFLATLPESWLPRRDDFVFCSGGDVCGCIEPVLKQFGLCRDSMTQVLVSGMTLPGPTGKPQDLSVKMDMASNGEEKWAGECAACGKWNGAVAERLVRNGIRCKTGFYREWRRFMWEQVMYDAAFNLVGVVRAEPTTLAQVALYYEQEVSDMMWQITGKLRGGLAVSLLYGFEERLFTFAERTGKETQCKLVDGMFPYVHGMMPTGMGNMHSEYLHYAKDERGLIPNVYLPPAAKMDELPIMREGNLRADGVL